MSVYRKILLFQLGPILLFIIGNATCAQSRGEGTGDVDSRVERVDMVTGMPGFVAFWDFVQREPTGERRFTAHVSEGITDDYALDAGNYVREYWGEGREVDYTDFPLLGRGPFGQAIQIREETDPSLRPYLVVPRSRLHDTPLDIKGKNASVSVVVWAVRESGNHALAGIWHEGTDLKRESTVGIKRIERGQRQYALFAGLAKPGSACGHISDNGAGSFTYKYAVHKCHTGDSAPEVPADSPAEILDTSWQCFAMTFDHQKNEIAGWLNGVSKTLWEYNMDSEMMDRVRNAWRQGNWSLEPGLQDGEDPTYPADQFYNPPEDEPLAIEVLSHSPVERVELHEFQYTKVKVVKVRGADGVLGVKDRDLVAIRLNPWWFPHAIYIPSDQESGGPFTIGRVIHSARSSGFSGWIGGVAVFDRALKEDELLNLSSFIHEAPLFAPID